MPPRLRRAINEVNYTVGALQDAANDSDDDEDFVVNDKAKESDVDMSDDEAVAEEEVEELADESEIEEEDAEKETNGKEKSKWVTQKTKKSLASTSKPTNKGPKQEIRTIKNLSNIKEKLFRLFGSNSEKLMEIVKLREDWKDSMFDFPDDKLKEYLPAITIKNVPEMKFIPLTEAQFDENFSLKNSINFSYNDGPAVTIEAGNIYSNDRAQILNTGGMVTDIAWLQHGSETQEQMLAVAVSGITNSTFAPEFSLLGGKSYTSGFLIYSLDTQAPSLKLIKAMVHNWCNCWDLQWKKHKGMGVLSAAFNDGKIRLLRLEYDDDNDVTYFMITEPSFEYSLPDTKLSSYDWIGDTLICGTEKGYVASFALCDPVPLYAYPLHSGYIFSIKAAKSKYDEDIVYTSTSDGYSALFSTVDIRKTKNVPQRNRSISKTVVYSPQLYSFIQLEGQYIAKLLPARALFVLTPIVKHDGSTECMATSNLHPMMLSGGADGKIKITNLARRVLNSQKQALAAHKILTLWELQYGGQEDIYRLIDNFEVECLTAQDNVTTVNVYPPGVAISSVKWNENQNAGKRYAASSTSGLLIVGTI